MSRVPSKHYGAIGVYFSSSHDDDDDLSMDSSSLQGTGFLVDSASLVYSEGGGGGDGLESILLQGSLCRSSCNNNHNHGRDVDDASSLTSNYSELDDSSFSVSRDHYFAQTSATDDEEDHYIFTDDDSSVGSATRHYRRMTAVESQPLERAANDKVLLSPPTSNHSSSSSSSASVEQWESYNQERGRELARTLLQRANHLTQEQLEQHNKPRRRSALARAMRSLRRSQQRWTHAWSNNRDTDIKQSQSLETMSTYSESEFPSTTTPTTNNQFYTTTLEMLMADLENRTTAEEIVQALQMGEEGLQILEQLRQGNPLEESFIVYDDTVPFRPIVTDNDGMTTVWAPNFDEYAHRAVSAFQKTLEDRQDINV